MKIYFTPLTALKNKSCAFAVKAFAILLITVFSQPNKLFAHTVDYFTTCGYACSGSDLVIDAHISNVNSGSRYNWQYRDNSNTWKCFVNGNNTINGVVFSVSNAIGSGVKTNMPITITNAKIALEDVEVRLIIADGSSPCTATTTIWGADKLLRLHVLAGSDCGTIASNCGSGGCVGNVLNDGTGYYGGFEAGNLSPASSDYGLGTTSCSCGEYKIVHNVQEVQSGFPAFAPHSGNYMMYADGDAASNQRVWYKTVNVTNGNIYQFSAWVANANTTSNAKANISLKVNGTVVATQTVTSTAGDWLYVSGTYIATATATITIQIIDNTVGCSDNDFVIDDICFKTLGSAVDLGNLVWNDIDADGKKDSNEPIVANATVNLYTDNNGDNIADGAPIRTTTTNSAGIYGFFNLPAGRYIVGVILPTGYLYGPGVAPGNASSATPDNNIDNDNNGIVHIGANAPGSEERTNAITLSTTDNLTLDLALCGSNTIGDFVWKDLNANGIQDNGETGIAGATVMITYPDGTTATTTTNSTGYYYFLALAPGVHRVTFTTPTGYTPSPANQGGDDTKDSDPVGGFVDVPVVGNNSNNLTVDAGFYITGSNTLSLGNLVWNDINADGNKDTEEPGIGGATVKLYRDDDGNNVPDGAAISSTTTATNGSYLFTGLTPGNYIVGVILPSGYTYGPGVGGGTTTSATPNNDIDNDNNGTVQVGPNTGGSEERTNFITLSIGGEPTTDGDGPNSNLTLDLALCGAGRIGDFVFHDQNKNGIQDLNEMGIDKVTVILTFPDGTTWTTLTDNNGKYQFINLGPGTYNVHFNTPIGMIASPADQGSDDTKDSDPIGGNVSVTLPANTSNLTIDAGFYRNSCTPVYLVDTDGDCIPDVDDIDDDNDGILDVVESGGYDPLVKHNGVPLYKDPNIANYPAPTGNDLYGKPYVKATWTDCNNDGINDFFDWDLDGIINELDLDSDNDGILDVQETRDPRMVDDNNDGMVDGVDVDGDGLLSTADYNDNVKGGPGLTPEDLDRDGHPNYLDLDSDGDGLTDNREALELDGPGGDGRTQGRNDDDHDGVWTVNYTNNNNDADNFQGFGAKGIILKDNDNDGFPNPYDIDSDNDGITDNVEGQPTCSEIQPSGVDADGDGLDDAYDNNISVCPRIGAGITPYDKDADGTPDIRDLDTDGDGKPDVNEGSIGLNGNAINRNDLDKDGLVDQFDIFNIKTATGNFTANVTHSNMGPNGSFDGPIPSGSKAELPGANCPSDRDWRNASVLPVSLIDFKGNLNAGIVKLNWTVANETNMQNYVVERSVNGTTWSDLATVKATGNAVGNTDYSLSDDVRTLTNTIVYYRLRQVEKTGTTKWSSAISFKLSNKSGNTLQVNPNPANTYFIMKVNAVKDGVATIRITDMTGRIMITQNTNMAVGTNAVTFNNLGKMAGGTYNVQVILNGEILNDKLVIIK